VEGFALFAIVYTALFAAILFRICTILLTAMLCLMARLQKQKEGREFHIHHWHGSSNAVCAALQSVQMLSSNSKRGWPLTLAAALFRTPKPLMTGSGMRSRAPPILKFCRERCVCAPQYLQEARPQ
jgi:hypothetical protein